MSAVDQNDITGIFDKLQYEIVQTIVEHLKYIGKFTPSDIHRLKQLQRMSVSQEDINRMIAKAAKLSVKKVRPLYEKSAREYYDYSKPLYQKTGVDFVPLEDNINMKRMIEGISKHSEKVIERISGNLGFINMNGKFESQKKFYQNTINYAIAQVETGTYDYNTAISKAVKALSDNGMQYIDYKTKRRNRARTAVDRALFTGMAQIREEISMHQGREFGADGMEISFHMGFRPSHWFGGMQFSMEQYENEIQPRLNDYNCRHKSFPIIFGVSKPAYTKEQLDGLNEKASETIEFEGDKLNVYEQTQKQRYLENAIRIQKERIVNFSALIDAKKNTAEYSEKDEEAAEEIRNSEKRIKKLMARYRELSRVSNLPQQTKRLEVIGYRAKETVSVKSVSSKVVSKAKPDIQLTEIDPADTKNYSEKSFKIPPKNKHDD